MLLFENETKNRRFKEVANKLLNNCFLIKTKDQDDYLFVKMNLDKFTEYFEVIGFELRVYEANNVIHLYNANGVGRQRLGKYESIILLLLRKLYIKKKKELSENTDIRITWEDLAEQYAMLKIAQKPTIDRQLRSSTLKMLRRFNLIDVFGADKLDETQIEIFPTILFALPSSDIETIYSMTEEKIRNLQGGDTDGEEDSD